MAGIGSGANISAAAQVAAPPLNSKEHEVIVRGYELGKRVALAVGYISHSHNLCFRS